MTVSPHRLWSAAILLLAGVLLLAGAASGGETQGGEPPQEPTVQPGQTSSSCYMWIATAIAEVDVGDIVIVELWQNWALPHFGAIGSYDASRLQPVDSAGQPNSCAEIVAPYDTVVGNTVGDGNFYVEFAQPGATEGPFVAAIMRFQAVGYGEAYVEIGMGYGGWRTECDALWIGTVSIRQPTATCTPSPSSTPTLGSRQLHGTVLDPAGAPVANAQLTLFRRTGASWTQQAAGPSGVDGVFRVWMNPIPGDYRLIVQPPAGYSAVSAALPEGMDGQVVSADTLAFMLDGAPGQVGPFAFVVEPGPTSTPTPSPQPTLPPVVLQGYVWLDMNGDGERQPGEGLAGVEVTLSYGGLSGRTMAALQAATTDAEGHYSFVTAPGDYTLAIHDPMGRVSDQSRAIDTEAWEPGPIDWGNWASWLPLISQTK